MPSSVRSSSPGGRAADDDAPAGELRAVERVQRAPVDVHDVVRHVDDVRDRPHPGRVQARAQPHRRRADGDVPEDAADVARAAVEVVDRDVDPLRMHDRRVVDGRPAAARRRRAPRPRARARPSRAGRRGSSSASRRAPARRTGRTSASGVPGSIPSGSTMIPAWSAPRPISSSARIIPRDSSPRSGRSSSGAGKPGSSTPGRPTATVAPTPKFQAPQTICRGSPSPTSTWQSWSLSAFGCFSAATTLPTRR